MLKIFNYYNIITVSSPINFTVGAITNSSVEANWTQSPPSPAQLVLRCVAGILVEANWTQPSSDSVWQYYTNHTITCTSTHGVYTATQHVNVSAAVNESMHAIITGLMANTSYNCCVSVYSELGRSEDVCGSVITGMEMYVLQQLIS